jgi:hypothetical protein
MSAKFEPRLSRKPIGPPFLRVRSIPRMRKVINNLIAEMLRKLTKILLTLGCSISFRCVFSLGLMLGQITSLAFIRSEQSDSGSIWSSPYSDSIKTFAICCPSLDYTYLNFFSCYRLSCQTSFSHFPFIISSVSFSLLRNEDSLIFSRSLIRFYRLFKSA